MYKQEKEGIYKKIYEEKCTENSHFNKEETRVQFPVIRMTKA